MLNTAIDACEQIEAAGFTESHRGVVLGNGRATGHDAVTSAWTMPESMRYEIVRARHDAGNAAPYVPVCARILVNMAQAAAELVGAPTPEAMAAPIRGMVGWYGQVMPELRAAIESSET